MKIFAEPIWNEMLGYFKTWNHYFCLVKFLIDIPLLFPGPWSPGHDGDDGQDLCEQGCQGTRWAAREGEERQRERRTRAIREW